MLATPTPRVPRPRRTAASPTTSRGAGPLVVAVPGMGDLRSTYRHLAPALVDAGFRVATMDLRGHGDSDTTFNAYDDAGRRLRHPRPDRASRRPGDRDRQLDGRRRRGDRGGRGPAAVTRAGAHRAVRPRRAAAVPGSAGSSGRRWPARGRGWSGAAYCRSSSPPARGAEFDRAPGRDRAVAAARPGGGRRSAPPRSTSHAPAEAVLDTVTDADPGRDGHHGSGLPGSGGRGGLIAGAAAAAAPLMVPDAGHYPHAEFPELTTARRRDVRRREVARCLGPGCRRAVIAAAAAEHRRRERLGAAHSRGGRGPVRGAPAEPVQARRGPGRAAPGRRRCWPRRELHEELTAAAVGRSGTDALLAMADAYRTFAQKHPGRYAASVVAPAAGDTEHERGRRGHRARTVAAVLGGVRPRPATTQVHAIRGAAVADARLRLAARRPAASRCRRTWTRATTGWSTGSPGRWRQRCTADRGRGPRPTPRPLTAAAADRPAEPCATASEARSLKHRTAAAYTTRRAMPKPRRDRVDGVPAGSPAATSSATAAASSSSDAAVDRPGRAGHHQRDLAAQPAAATATSSASGAAPHLLVGLGQLPAERRRPVGAERVDHRGERLGQPVHRLEEDHRPALAGERRPAPGPAPRTCAAGSPRSRTGPTAARTAPAR